jgi:uncharacterized protein (TIGR03435 family)
MRRRVFSVGSIAAYGAVILFSQEPKPPAFEVASVKPSASGAGPGGKKGGPGAADPELFSTRNRTLNALLLMAYGVQDYQLSGGPSWAASDRFDIQAKPAEAASRDQMMLMLRTLLSERFELRLHHETKELPAYVLTIARNGPKFGAQFRKVDEAALAAELEKRDSSLGIPLGGTMQEFAFLIRSNMKMIHPPDAAWAGEPPPVIDQTGLSGIYSIFLKIHGPTDDLPAEMEAQLGLKTSLRKIPTDVLIIDGAAKPSVN